MAADPWASSNQLKALIQQLDDAVRDAEQVRGHVERQMRARTIWPDRREPRHWQRIAGDGQDDQSRSDR